MHVIHILFTIFATWRLTEVLTQDAISEKFRKRFPSYFWGCNRCVSVWAGIVCTAAYVYFPWFNWPLALSLVYLLLLTGWQMVIGITNGITSSLAKFANKP